MNDRTSIPGLTLTEYGYEGQVNLSTWVGFQDRQGAYGAKSGKGLSDGLVKIDIGGDMVEENPEVSAEHINSYYYLLDNQKRVKASILRELLRIYPKLREQYGYDRNTAREIMPNVYFSSSFRRIIGLSAIHIMNVSRDGCAFVGYEFGCAWDGEHGLGAMVYKDKVVEIGGADTSILTWIAEKYNVTGD